MPEWLNDWAKKFWADLLEVLSGKAALDIVDKLTSWWNALWNALSFESIRSLGTIFQREAPERYREIVPELADFLTWELEVITGLPIDRAKILGAISPTPESIDMVALGKILSDPFFMIFDPTEVAEGYKQRMPGAGEVRNLERFIGHNTRLQVGGMAVNTLSSILPFNLPNAFKDIPEKVDNILGWQDLMEEVIQEPIQKLVSEGLAAKFLRETKPVDLAFTEAMRAFHAGDISRAVLDKILDNLGYRDDTRDMLIRVNEADLTESQLQEVYDKRLVSEDDVNKYFREKGHGQDSAALKTRRVVDGRLWDLLDKISDQMLTLYRDCVIPADEVRLWLSDQGWTDNEIAAAIALEEMKRRQRTFLTDSELEKAMKSGLLSADEVKEYLTCKGATDLDATIKLILMLQEDLPKDCWDKLKPENFLSVLIAIINGLGGAGVFTLPGGLAKLVACLLAEPLGAEALPPEAPSALRAKLPTGSLSTLPSSPQKGEQFRLVWSVDNADTVDIDQGVGRVQAQGVLFLTAQQNTVWTLTAANEAGSKTFQASILVKPAPVERPARLPAPTASLSVSPARVFEGDTYSVVWETQNADQVFLDQGEGPVAVNPDGAKFLVSDKSRIFTLVASGPGGQRQRSDTLTVRPSPAEGVKPPSAAVSITPARVKAGEQYELRWSTANADYITLDGVAGTEVLTPAGARIGTAERDLVVKLFAVNSQTGELRTAMDTLIVEEPAEPREPTRPAPSVSLTLRPSSTKRGETVAVEWRTQNADTVTIQHAGGIETIDPIGGTTIVAEATDTFILHAKGPGGERAIAKVLVVK